MLLQASRQSRCRPSWYCILRSLGRPRTDWRRFAAAPVASRRKTPSSPNRPNDTTVILRGLSAACTAATIDTHVRRKTVTGALSRLTSNSIVTTNLHSNTFRACRRARARPLGQHTGGSHRPTRSLSASSSRAGFAYLHLVILSADKESFRQDRYRRSGQSDFRCHPDKPRHEERIRGR